jgi:hypothetical protein
MTASTSHVAQHSMSTSNSSNPTNVPSIQPIASSSTSTVKKDAANKGKKPQDLVIKESDNATYVYIYTVGAILIFNYFRNLFAIHWKEQAGHNGTTAEFNKAWRALSKEQKEVCLYLFPSNQNIL